MHSKANTTRAAVIGSDETHEYMKDYDLRGEPIPLPTAPSEEHQTLATSHYGNSSGPSNHELLPVQFITLVSMSLQ